MSTVRVAIDVDIDDLMYDVDDEYLLKEVKSRGLSNPAELTREDVQYLIGKLDDEPIASMGDDIRAKLVRLRMDI